MTRSRPPVLISIPHGGLTVPEELVAINQLSPEETQRDGDEEAIEIYGRLEQRAARLISADIARAFVDLNRARDDFRRDGVVKTHTCWDVPIYRRPLEPDEIERLLSRYYDPFHQRLRHASTGLLIGIDCHTMATVAPPVSPDYPARRPAVCISNVDGLTCPHSWLKALERFIRRRLTDDVALNRPFKGGFITRSRPGGIPWLQLELARGPWAAVETKRTGIEQALVEFVDWLAS